MNSKKLPETNGSCGEDGKISNGQLSEPLDIAATNNHAEMPNGKCSSSQGGMFGTPPSASLNFYSSLDVSDSDKDRVPMSLDTGFMMNNGVSSPQANGHRMQREGSGLGIHRDLSGHEISAPYEVPNYPIEREETKLMIQRQISEMVRHEQEAMSAAGKVPENGQNQRLAKLQIFDTSFYHGVGGAQSLNSPQGLPIQTFRDTLDVNYQRMAISGETLSGMPLEDLKEASSAVVRALRLRRKYTALINHKFPRTAEKFLTGEYPDHLPPPRRKESIMSHSAVDYHPPKPPQDHWHTPVPERAGYVIRASHGVFKIYEKDGQTLVPELEDSYIAKKEFLEDYQFLVQLIADGPLKSFCYRRLAYLHHKFQLHVLLNEMREMAEQKCVPHRDFYNIRKVDTHVHAASSMNQKHLLRFIKKTIKTCADDLVSKVGDKILRMEEVFQKLNLQAYDLSVDMLDVHADRNTFHRFDKFNSKYNPVGESQLREIFIKTDNLAGGVYFARVLKEVLEDLEESKYQQAEPRLSIYGRTRDEWDKLAIWAIKNDVWSTNVCWIVQIPRLYDIYRSKGMVQNFQEIIDNIFLPLFEATENPESHPELHQFLRYVGGIDSVDDESKPESMNFDCFTPSPEEWANSENPPYNYYLFYMYANLAVLNRFRKMRGLNTIALRPHCGEAGTVYHLVTGFLCAESIAHGLLLRKVPVLQYLYYLCQLGMAMSPLSNNSLFLNYHRNPMQEFHAKGLNVSLSTDDPLQFHFTKEPLMEEYSIAAQVWKWSTTDTCEIARNSVLQSSFPHETKIHWLGPLYEEDGVLGNDMSRTNVPDIRVSFRHESLVDELCTIFNGMNMTEKHEETTLPKENRNSTAKTLVNGNG